MDAPSAGCISDDALWRLASSDVSADERDAAHAHLDDCPICTAALLTIVRSSPAGRPGDPADRAAPGGLPSSPITATQLGRFVLRDTLGSGSMGTVYTAWDPQLDREVAIKVLRAGRADDRDAARLLREARAMAQVRHPNVVTVYEVGQDHDVIFVAMERITGPTLRAAMATDAATPAQVVRWLAQVAAGLAAVHAAGLTHRDVKPDNIFVEGDRAVVGDFGLATEAIEIVASTSGDTASAVGTRRAGTPAYMAPEQLRGADADARTDVFAFGVTGWEVLHGARPYGGHTAEAIARAVAAGLPSVPTIAGVSPIVMRMLARCVHPDRAQRPPGMAQVIAALAPVAGHGGRRRVAVAVGLGAVVAAGATFATLALRSTTQPTAAVAPCDPAAPSTWDQAGPAWLARASKLAPAARDGIAAIMTRRRADWAGLGATACAGDVFARTAWVDCRARVEHDEGMLLELAVERAWPDDLALARTFDDLDAPAVCASKEAAEDALAMARLTPPARAAVVAGLGLLVRARAVAGLEDGAGVDRALAEARAAATTAAAPVLDAELQLATAELRPPPTTAAKVAALQAVAAAAERTGRAALIARTWLALATHASEFELDAATVATALAQAEWAIDRLDRPARLRVRWLTIKAEDTWARGDRVAARRELAEAMTLAAADPYLANSQRQAVARIASLGGDDVAAAAAYRELLDDPALVRALDARTHVRLLALLAECQYRLGQADLAAATIAAALDRGRAALPPDDPMQIIDEVIAASIDDDRGQPAAALARLDAARAAGVRALGADNITISHIQLRRAQALFALDRAPDGLAAARDAVQIADARRGRGNEVSLRARDFLAKALYMTGDAAGSLAMFAEVDADSRALYGADHPMWAQGVPPFASVLANTGHLPEAVRRLDEAIAVLVKASFAPAIIADARYELAQLVVEDDPARAAALGGQALADASPDHRDEIAAWVRRHPVRGDRQGR